MLVFLRLIQRLELKMNLNSFSVDGGWGTWSEFSACSRNCGNGWRVRYRYCNNPSPTRRGRFCRGDNKEKVQCKEKPCPGGCSHTV